jgi:hypothetical protein
MGGREINVTGVKKSSYEFYKDANYRHFLYETVYHDEIKKNAHKGKANTITLSYLHILRKQGFKKLPGADYWKKMNKLLVSEKLSTGIAELWNEEFNASISFKEVNGNINGNS